jgi:hypothetical protein
VGQSPAGTVPACHGAADGAGSLRVGRRRQGAAGESPACDHAGVSTNAGPGRARYLNIHAPDAGFAELMRARDRGDEPNPEDHDISGAT